MTSCARRSRLGLGTQRTDGGDHTRSGRDRGSRCRGGDDDWRSALQAHDGIKLVSFRAMGMTLRPSEQQAEALRRQAAAEGRSMQAVALSAIDEYIARRTHKAKVAAAVQRVVEEEAAVLARLKDA